jgi:glycerol-3-phosphate cytidylyltransferase
MNVVDLEYLTTARSLCQHLVVGVVSDSAAAKAAGAMPAVPLLQRTQIVASLGVVDEVVPMETLDVLDVWNSVQYDALFLSDPQMELVDHQFMRELESVGVDVVELGGRK